MLTSSAKLTDRVLVVHCLADVAMAAAYLLEFVEDPSRCVALRPNVCSAVSAMPYARPLLE